MRVLALTSCTGEKVANSKRALTLADFQGGTAQIAKRERELIGSLMAAGEIYTGEQHVRLMRGVNAYRDGAANKREIDLYILSAGYGIIPETRKIAPYECTFADMKAKDLMEWAKRLRVPQDFRKVVAQPYDSGLILLGDNYLKACMIDASVKFGGPTLLLCGSGTAKKLPQLYNLRVVTLSNSEAKRFSCGLVGLKGELAGRLLKRLTNTPELVSRILDPMTDLLTLMEDKDVSLPDEVKQTRIRSVANPKVDYVIKIPPSWWNKEHRKKFRYFIPEWDDLVDPDYDFLTDTHSGGSGDWSNEVYAHQMYPEPNYDGILVSRAIAEKSRKKKERINALGVHRFLRVPRGFPIMGDCGAFDYIMQERPPYSTEDVLDYYTRLDFDFGVSVDHLIVTATEAQKHFRYDLTVYNAEDFLKQHRNAGLKWEPIGAVQGWDPESYASAAKQYVKMGYRYIGLGGLVRTPTPEILRTLEKVCAGVPMGIGVHLFGLARLNSMERSVALGVTSVDSASPMRRAWLGAKDNYRTVEGPSFRAIRIPAVGKSFRAKRMVQEGRATIEEVTSMEAQCLKAVRAYDRDETTAEAVVDLLEEFDSLISEDRRSMRADYLRTLSAKPWKSCPCDICRRDGIDVIIFRGNNRNRRRGFHNTYVFYNHLQRLLAGENLSFVHPRGADDEDDSAPQMELDLLAV